MKRFKKREINCWIFIFICKYFFTSINVCISENNYNHYISGFHKLCCQCRMISHYCIKSHIWVFKCLLERENLEVGNNNIYIKYGILSLDSRVQLFWFNSRSFISVLWDLRQVTCSLFTSMFSSVNWGCL